MKNSKWLQKLPRTFLCTNNDGKIPYFFRITPIDGMFVATHFPRSIYNAIVYSKLSRRVWYWFRRLNLCLQYLLCPHFSVCPRCTNHVLPRPHGASCSVWSRPPAGCDRRAWSRLDCNKTLSVGGSQACWRCSLNVIKTAFQYIEQTFGFHSSERS